MESAKATFLDQARADRDRAESYRHLAKLIVSCDSRAALLKVAAELDDRAANLERWAADFEARPSSEHGDAAERESAPSLAPRSPATL